MREIDNSCPGEGWIYAAPCLASHPFFHLPLAVLAAPLGGASAAEEQGALSALEMDCSSCGFDRACNRPANTPQRS
jgi:hypothetical protein